MNNVFKFMVMAFVVGGLNVQAMNNNTDRTTQRNVNGSVPSEVWTVVSANGHGNLFSETKRSNDDINISSYFNLGWTSPIYVSRNDVSLDGQQVVNAIACVCRHMMQQMGVSEFVIQFRANGVYSLICERHNIEPDEDLMPSNDRHDNRTNTH